MLGNTRDVVRNLRNHIVFAGAHGGSGGFDGGGAILAVGYERLRAGGKERRTLSLVRQRRSRLDISPELLIVELPDACLFVPKLRHSLGALRDISKEYIITTAHCGTRGKGDRKRPTLPAKKCHNFTIPAHLSADKHPRLLCCCYIGYGDMTTIDKRKSQRKMARR